MGIVIERMLGAVRDGVNDAGWIVCIYARAMRYFVYGRK
jgi:hypothetical protein